MIVVTGASGFLGQRVCNLLKDRAISHIKTSYSLGLDLRDRQATIDWFLKNRPLKIINCAAYVGGIQFGYKHPAELFHNNLLITLNLLEAAHAAKVKRIVNPISNCAYPAAATYFKEDEFWDGPMHDSVMVYGFTRKASWVGSWAYAKQYGLDTINVILSNMYGPGDHFDEERSHALGALIMKFVKARIENRPEVIIWGTGKPVREWLHVDDGAESLVRALDIASYDQPINIGIGKGISIAEMSTLIANIVGYNGRLVFDPSRPDGAPYKTVDGSRGSALLNWSPNRDFINGIKETVAWYSAQHLKAEVQ